MQIVIQDFSITQEYVSFALIRCQIVCVAPMDLHAQPVQLHLLEQPAHLAQLDIQVQDVQAVSLDTI